MATTTQSSIAPFVNRDSADGASRSRPDMKLLRGTSRPLRRDAGFGAASGAVLGAVYALPRSSLSEEEVLLHCEALTMRPIDFSSFSKKDSSFPAFELDQDWLRVPRFYGVHNFGRPARFATSRGRGASLDFTGTLKEAQVRASEACVAALSPPDNGGAMMVLPCGYGKTIVALHVAAQLGVRTLVLVHKSFLVEQWRDRVGAFFRDASVGKIQCDTVDADVDVCIAMVQSLSVRDYDDGVLGDFGLLIVDEAHHMSAPCFSRALRKLRCARILALSATPERKDGLTQLLFWSMGPIVHRVERTPEALDVFVLACAAGKRREILTRDGQVCMPKMINEIAEDGARTAVIAKAMARLHVLGRRIIVLSDRVAQLHSILAAFAAEAGDDAADGAAFYIGKTRMADRERAAECSPLLSTFAMAKEGLDIPALDTLILATPKGDVEQSVGRIQRPCRTKQSPLVVDVFDNYSVFRNLRRKRARHFDAMRYTQTDIGEADLDRCFS